MPLPDPPDLARPKVRLVLTALGVTFLVALLTGFRDASTLARTLGDTDDAMRMVLVRGLLHGQGWWDQQQMRLQPPMGVYMHWSRLLDGAIASLDWLLSLFTGAAQGEWLTRLIWPLLWIFPASVAALSIADSLDQIPSDRRSPGAVLICAFLLATNLVLYIQFHPGRVDHHDVQMSLCFLAFAGACARRSPEKGALLAGGATGLGLAIGLEALLFEAAIGAALALRFVFDDRAAKPLVYYGVSLASVTVAAFLVQTPPWRWGVSACDALALNSAAAAGLAGLAVALVSHTIKVQSPLVRFGALGLAAIASAGVYLGLDSGCLRGPFADVNPAIKSFWLVHVQEMRPWLKVLHDKFEDAVVLAAPPVLGILALIWLGLRREVRQDPVFRLTSALLLMTMAAGFSGARMIGYADWVAIPAIAVAAADIGKRLAGRYHQPLLIGIILAAVLATPEGAANAVLWVRNTVVAATKTKNARKPAPKTPDHCFETAPYRLLGNAGPPGLVLSEIDLGPFILAHTNDSVLAAPYHRMSWGMLKARDVLSGDADNGQAEAKARALGVVYVLECFAHRGHSDRVGLSPRSLQKRLDEDKGQPNWLERLDPPHSILEVFRVKPVPR